jgi:DUF4097 and DUF4098 domain-containing protein YvlB
MEPVLRRWVDRCRDRPSRRITGERSYGGRRVSLHRSTRPLRAQERPRRHHTGTSHGDAELATGTGEVRAGEIDGSAVIRNSNGDTRIREVNGDLKVKAANGHIDVDHSHGSVNARTANGWIRVGSIQRGSLVAKTAAGRIEVGIASGAAARLHLHTRHGHVHNDLDATAGPAAGDDERVDVRANTGWGDITIRPAA